MVLSSGIVRERLDGARLYAITPDAPSGNVEALVTAWIRGGADMVQLRSKALARGEVLALARRLAPVCADAGVLFIVNDHLDIAMLSGADGVHLGEDDLSLDAARRIAGPDLVVGASAATPQAARSAQAAGADYLGAGPAYATPIKAAKPPIGPGGVRAVQESVNVPVFAIGGIDGDRVPELRSAGVHRICVIRALAGAADPEGEARRLREALSG